jgi:hypothetical protein
MLGAALPEEIDWFVFSVSLFVVVMVASFYSFFFMQFGFGSHVGWCA